LHWRLERSWRFKRRCGRRFQKRNSQVSYYWNGRRMDLRGRFSII
jgi:hypothetical protein